MQWADHKTHVSYFMFSLEDDSSVSSTLLFLTSKQLKSTRDAAEIVPNISDSCGPEAVAPLSNLSFNSENENALSPFNVTSSDWLGQKIDGARVTKTGSDKVQGFWLGVGWVCVVVNVMCDVGSVSEYMCIYIYF